jgi:MFS family permease
MLGLFLVLPVFALEASRLPGGDDAARVGLAMGMYGLTQAFLQIPFGLASDRFGRKPTSDDQAQRGRLGGHVTCQGQRRGVFRL